MFSVNVVLKFLNIFKSMIGKLSLCVMAMALTMNSLEAAVTVAGSFSKGKESALKSKKDCLVFNYGDWDKLSTKMYEKNWKATTHLNKYLEPNTVIADVKVFQFPTKAQQREIERKGSDTMLSLEKADRFFLVPCQPSVIFIDKTSFPYAILEGVELPEDPEQFAKAVAEIQSKRAQRDQILEAAMKLKGKERAAMIMNASEVPGIKPDNARFAELVKACDPEDELGYYRRFTFDIFELHTVLNEKKEDGLKLLDEELYKPGLSKEQQQMVLGLRGKILRVNLKGGDEAMMEELRANFQRMMDLDPDSVMGKSAKNALRVYCNVGEGVEEDNSGDEDRSIYLDDDFDQE